MSDFIELERRYGVRNYHPLPVVLARGEGCHVWDIDGNRYLDMMSAYSAVSHGHSHPKLLRALNRQSSKLSVVSRAFYTDRLGPFLEKLCLLTGLDRALPMNTGAEAVETAIKAARKWAYEVKGVAPNQAQIISCAGNFHGRTLAAVAMSTDSQYQRNFGPFPPGFVTVEYGDASALDAAITPETAAFIVEPIQGEGGIVIPPEGYLTECAGICRERNVLLICDEIQTGLGRTGTLLASEHDRVKPDGVTLGKALGGGLYPVSAFVARAEILDLFQPGDHGSTFGGNPLAAVIGYEALRILEEDGLIENCRQQGAYFLDALGQIGSPLISAVRGRGLMIGLEIDASRASARTVCEKLMARGILTKETHETVVRLAPPLIVQRDELDFAIEAITDTLEELDNRS